MQKLLLGCTLTAALAACAHTPVPIAATPVPAADSASLQCDASKAQDVIGQPPTSALQERARTAAGAQVVRVLRHDQVVTMEFREGRLNLTLDPSGRIATATCG